MDKSVRVNELLVNKDFQQKSQAITTKEEARKLFAEFGVELTTEEVDSVLLQLGAMLSAMQSDELSADDLDDVSGGALEIPIAIKLTGTAAAAFGISCGVVIGLGALALGGYVIYKTLRS